jgi:hypothetical protein
MEHKIARTTVVLIALAMDVASMVPSAYAGQCSQEGAVGKYALSASGTVIGIGPRVSVASLTFNAAGEVHGPVTASLNGEVTQTTLSGTYTLNPDCSGAASFGEFDQAGNLVLTATVALAWDDNMREVRFIFTSVVPANSAPLPTAVTGVGRKLGD